jgi:hypothetical protein
MTNGIPKLWSSDILIIFGGTRRTGNYFAWDNPFFFTLFPPHFFCFEVSLRKERGLGMPPTALDKWLKNMMMTVVC